MWGRSLGTQGQCHLCPRSFVFFNSQICCILLMWWKSRCHQNAQKWKPPGKDTKAIFDASGSFASLLLSSSQLSSSLFGVTTTLLFSSCFTPHIYITLRNTTKKKVHQYYPISVKWMKKNLLQSHCTSSPRTWASKPETGDNLAIFHGLLAVGIRNAWSLKM